MRMQKGRLNASPFVHPVVNPALSQQGKRCLRDLVRLRQDGRAGLGQDLGPGEICGFRRNVDILDT